MSEGANVLIVEDESIVALEIGDYVEELGFNLVGIVSSADKALQRVESEVVDLVLMDVRLKGEKDGITCAQEIKKIKQDMPIIYISAFSDDETLSRAVETDPSSYLTKPFNPRELKFAMQLATKTIMSPEKITKSREFFIPK